MKRYFRFLSRAMLAGLAAALLTVSAPNPAEALSLTVDGGIYSLFAGTLTYTNENIGFNTLGQFNHTGGVNKVTNSLSLGYNSTGSGSYNLSGTGLLITDHESIGVSGSGTFTQTGGKHNIVSVFQGMVLGVNSGSNGQYNLNSGAVSVNRNQVIGLSGTGSFTQSGGSNTISSGTLFLGSNAGSNGRYDLSNTGKLSAGTVDIGHSGTGLFTQTGGSNKITNLLVVGNGLTGNGDYTLSGGALSAGYEVVAYNGTGTFTQTGGTNTLVRNTSIANSGILSIGLNATSNGTYNLSGTGALFTNAVEVGSSGTGTFIQSGGTHTITYDPSIWYLSGSLAIGLNSGSTGNYYLEGSGTLLDSNVSIGGRGTGSFIQTGGTHIISSNSLGDPGWLNLGWGTTGTGNYTLSGAGMLSAGKESIGSVGTGTFTQTGGANSITNDLTIASSAGSTGLYRLSGGTYTPSGGFNGIGGTLPTNGWSSLLPASLSADTEYVGQRGNGTFIQSGGINSAKKLIIAAQAGSTGLYNLSGGTLNVQNATGTGTITNNGTFNYSGGTLNADQFNNNTNFNISGTGTRTVNGNVTNSATGTIKTTDTTAIFSGTFTNNGAYISDPSSNYFTDLIVGSTGYLVGGVGDNFYISGNFLNHSAQNMLWNTVDAYLGFTGTGVHDFYLTGGLSSADFLWGTMEVVDGGTLNLLGGLNSDLYVNNLVLSAGSNLNLNGFNIRYTTLTDLGGSYTGGLLIASTGGTGTSAVPEPSTLLLLGSGLAGLGFVRRRFKK